MKKKLIGGKELGFSTLVMVLGALALSGLVGMLAGKQILPEKIGPALSIILTELLVLVVCYGSVRKLPQSRLPAALLMVTPFLLLRVLAGLFVMEGEGIDPIRCLLTVGVAVASGLLASRKKQRRR